MFCRLRYLLIILVFTPFSWREKGVKWRDYIVLDSSVLNTNKTKKLPVNRPEVLHPTTQSDPLSDMVRSEFSTGVTPERQTAGTWGGKQGGKDCD